LGLIPITGDYQAYCVARVKYSEDPMGAFLRFTAVKYIGLSVSASAIYALYKILKFMPYFYNLNNN